MQWFKLYDSMSPEGEYYKVDEVTGDTWCTDANGKWEIPAFIVSAKYKGATQYDELVDYASKYGKLEEVESPRVQD